MPTQNDVVSWFKRQVGVTESPPGSNRVRYWSDIGRPNLQGQPWCAALQIAGNKALGIADSGSAYCPARLDWFRNMGRLYTLPKVGDEVFYQFGAKPWPGHTGRVVGIDGQYILAVEGNTSPGDSGSQDNGGGVYIRRRHLSQCVGFGRPVLSSTTKPKEDDMALPKRVNTPTNKGYWIATKDGGLQCFGDAKLYYAKIGTKTHSNAIGLSSSPLCDFTVSATGKGYSWLNVKGEVFNFGDAPSYGNART